MGSLYRVHEKPDAKRVYDFEVIAATFGYSLGVGALPIHRVKTKTDRRSAYGTGKRVREIEVPTRCVCTLRRADVSEADGEDCGEAGGTDSQLSDAAVVEAGAVFGGESGALCAGGDFPTRILLRRFDRYPDLIVHRVLKDVLRRGQPQHNGNAALSRQKTARQGWRHLQVGWSRRGFALVEAADRSVRPTRGIGRADWGGKTA